MLDALTAQHAERVLKSYEHMRDDVTWNPVIAGLAEGCWGDSRQQALQSKNHLASMSKLDCSLLVLSANCEPALRPWTQASADSAYEQLMAEETQAANMAAARPSKMLRQQAKRQKQQQRPKALDVRSQPLLSVFENLDLQQQPSAKD
ncbi:TPA: hypothetical protein ACH3X1_006645 [Trebouxia sp. C0004]